MPTMEVGLSHPTFKIELNITLYTNAPYIILAKGEKSENLYGLYYI